jgi:1,4-dihydroxy-2-naphthoate octaprenyltransferase
LPNIWIKEVRAPFLLIPAIFVPVGLAMAWSHGGINLLTALLTLVGALAMHASVNMLNDYFDFKSGLDLATLRTPFSGGSGVLPSGELTPNNVLYAGVGTLLVGFGIGSYFIYAWGFDPVLLTILALATVSVAGYSSVFSHWGLGELMAGASFGPLLVLGTYYLQTGTVAVEPILVGTSLGILVAGILYINEFPDSKADEMTGRRHLVVRWGKNKAAYRFRLLIASSYAIIVIGVLTGLVTPLALVALIALPKAWNGTRILGNNYDGNEALIPGMASIVMATLLTGALLFAGYVVLHFI